MDTPRSVRNTPREGEVSTDVYGFLTTEPNADAAPIHPKTMPVILTTLRGARRLVARTVDKAERLQWLLPNGARSRSSPAERSKMLLLKSYRAVTFGN